MHTDINRIVKDKREYILKCKRGVWLLDSAVDIIHGHYIIVSVLWHCSHSKAQSTPDKHFSANYYQLTNRVVVIPDM